MEVADPLPVLDYLRPQGRFSKLSPEEVAQVQDQVDDHWNRLCQLASLG